MIARTLIFGGFYILPLVDFVLKEDPYMLPLVDYVPKEDIVVQYFDSITSLQLHLFTIFNT